MLKNSHVNQSDFISCQLVTFLVFSAYNAVFENFELF